MVIDVRESFPTTENASGAGVPLTSVVPGQATAGTAGAVGFAFQDSNGNAVLPQLNSKGQILVSSDDSVAQPSRAYGRASGVVAVTGANDYSNYVTILSIPVVAASGYGYFGGKVSSRKDSFFELVYSDNGGSLVVLDSTMVGPGQYSAPLGLGSNEDFFQVPASAISPVFAVRGVNFNTVSDLHATLAVLPF